MTEPNDDEDLLVRFRHWLDEARAAAEQLGENVPPPGPSDGPGVGLYRLVEEFTALRHEVKLQTKGARGLQEQADALLAGLRQAIEQFRSVGPREDEAAWAASRPLAKALADLDEALDRGQAEVAKARQRMADDPLPAALEALFRRQWWFRRRRVRSYHEEVLAVVASTQRVPPGLIDALVEGYDLVHARLLRTLDSEQIRRIDCVGQPVDPGRMTVVAMVDAPDRPPGSVVDEVRRGYTWRGRVLRFAEVCAVRQPAQGNGPVADQDPTTRNE